MADTIGTPIWYELLTTDIDGAKQFYGEIVGLALDPQGAAVGFVSGERQ